MPRRPVWPVFALLVGCSAPPGDNPEFSHAAVYAFSSFEAPEAELAFALRELEARIHGAMDVDADAVQDRAFALPPLTDRDVAGLERPDRPASAALPIAVAAASPHDVGLHAPVQLLTDHTPFEPHSPDTYDRVFLDHTDACWGDRGCDTLRTVNHVVREHALLSIPYELDKEFRWVDLALPDPADPDPGADHEPRWAIAARSWTRDVFVGENGRTAIEQTYTLELWIPRDGRSTADPGVGGTLRFLALWDETDVGFDAGDDLVTRATRAGIDRTFEALDDYISEHPPS